MGTIAGLVAILLLAFMVPKLLSYMRTGPHAGTNSGVLMAGFTMAGIAVAAWAGLRAASRRS